MLCHYCGSPVNVDDIEYEQKLGITTDDPEEGSVSEETYLVGSAACSTCGTQTKSVVTTYINLGDVENEYQSERRTAGEPI